MAVLAIAAIVGFDAAGGANDGMQMSEGLSAYKVGTPHCLPALRDSMERGHPVSSPRGAMPLERRDATNPEGGIDVTSCDMAERAGPVRGSEPSVWDSGLRLGPVAAGTQAGMGVVEATPVAEGDTAPTGAEVGSADTGGMEWTTRQPSDVGGLGLYDESTASLVCATFDASPYGCAKWLAIADCETGPPGMITPQSVSPSGLYWGAFQIWRGHWQGDPAELLNLEVNVAMAWALSGGGTDLSPWPVCRWH